MQKCQASQAFPPSHHGNARATFQTIVKQACDGTFHIISHRCRNSYENALYALDLTVPEQVLPVQSSSQLFRLIWGYCFLQEKIASFNRFSALNYIRLWTQHLLRGHLHERRQHILKTRRVFLKTFNHAVLWQTPVRFYSRQSTREGIHHTLPRPPTLFQEFDYLFHCISLRSQHYLLFWAVTECTRPSFRRRTVHFVLHRPSSPWVIYSNPAVPYVVCLTETLF